MSPIASERSHLGKRATDTVGLQERHTRPFLRWAGGKAWLAPELSRLLGPVEIGSYFEPFLGGGAVFFAYNWPTAWLGDLNGTLLAAYRGLAQDVEAITKRLSSLRISPGEYARIRLVQPRTDVGHAVRLIYLNRASYGGIYRTNRHGVYNVPYSGDRSIARLLLGGTLRAAAEALTNATLTHDDFAVTLSAAGTGSFIFCDPVYTLPEPERSFRRYGTPTFSWHDQERLAEIVRELAKRGALIAVCNSPDARVARLYGASQVLHFKRRQQLPKAGQPSVEAVYLLGDWPSALNRMRSDGR